ncbi:hypothetical protein FOZ62_029030 [Perkinsus olseni]|uniref:Vesicle transport protein n=1 Tax=Perkinsus olseni TaxID=32597 RepID=A0A7J6RN74_PEROL|nr:hypothetical protein FOZ62_029030 [Perkinsus olseni]
MPPSGSPSGVVPAGWWPSFNLPQLSTSVGQDPEAAEDDGVIEYICPDLTLKQRVGYRVGRLLLSRAAHDDCLHGVFEMADAGQTTSVCTHVLKGNLCELGSTVFLVGPVRQWRSMSQKHRAWAASIYFTTMIITLVVCFKWPEERLLIVVLVITQCGAIIWYSLSYVPYGRHIWFDEPKHTPIGAGFWWLLTHDVKTFYKWDSALRLTVFSLVLYYVYAAYKNLKFKRSERIPETPQQRMQRHQDERVARKETAALHNTYQNKMLQEWRDGSEDRIAKVLQQIEREQELLKEWEIVEVGEDTAKVDGDV